MPLYFRTNDAGGGARYFRTNDAPESALLTVSTDNVVVGVESNAPYTSIGGAAADGIAVSSTNTAETQGWVITGVTGGGGTIVSTTRGNLPYTDANHVVTAGLYADVLLLGSRVITHNPPAGFIALPISEADADRTQNQSIAYGLPTITANSQIKVPTSIGGFGITWELSSGGNATGRFSIDGILSGSTSMLGVELRDGVAGTWSDIEVTVSPLGMSGFCFVAATTAAALTTGIPLLASISALSTAADAELTANGVSGRSIQVRLLASPQNPQPVALKGLRMWTRIAEGYAPVDGGIDGLNVTTDENGYAFLTGLSIAAGAGVLTVLDPVDQHKSRNLHVEFQ